MNRSPMRNASIAEPRAGRAGRPPVWRPLSATAMTPGGRSPAPARRRRRRMHLERAQVAAVHADDRRAGVERARRARRASCTSTSAASPSVAAPPRAAAELAIVERGDDQQHGVGAGGARLDDLELGDDEVLAEQRQIDGRAHRAQVIERAVEERRLGQHRDRRGAGARVRPARSRPGRSRARSTPRDGDRRLHSAMTRTPGACSAGAKRRAVAAPRPASRDRSRSARPTRSRSSADRRARRDDGRRAGRRVMRRTRSAGASRTSRARPLVEARRRQRDALLRASRARPATSSAAPALSSTMSRRGPRLAVEQRSIIAGVLGRGAAGQVARPRRRQADVGRMHVERVHRAVAAAPTPSCGRSSRSRRGRRRRARPTRARRRAAPSVRATSSVCSGRDTPTSWRRAPAGFVSGPSRLNAVRTPSSRRVGPGVPHRRMPRRREEEREVRPRRAPATTRVGRAHRASTPSASKTSALPHRLDTARLPCLATRTPAPASTIAAAVETLNVCAPSPPVPQVSNTSATGRGSGTARARIARANPTISRGPFALERERHQERRRSAPAALRRP